MFSWKRFWSPRGVGCGLTSEGYLIDPDAGHFNSKLAEFSAIDDVPCLALLGEPGIGKSTVIESLNHDHSSAALLSFDLKEYGDEGRLVHDVFRSSAIEKWLNGHHTLELLFDGLDECQLRIPYIASTLSGEFKKLGDYTRRLRLRIACRSANWPTTLEECLRSVFGGNRIKVYELAPLRRVDVALAARESGVDAEAFLNEIESKRAESLAAKPVSLDFLLTQFKRNQKLPPTQAELYETGCLVLCEETSKSRRDAGFSGKLSASQRLMIASRIAAVLCLSGRFTVNAGVLANGHAPEDIPLLELCGGSEKVGEDSLKVSETELREVLDTGLFSGQGPHRFGFSHQTYMEFLAARYLKHRLEYKQISRLLCCDDGTIFPQLAEVGAWLAGIDDRIFQMFLKNDPYALLRSDMAKADESTRATLLEALLVLFEREQLNDSEIGLASHYRNLNHSGLAVQLEPYLRDKSKCLIVRRFAIDVAEECRVSSLQKTLASLALDETDDPRIREYAAAAVARVGDEIASIALKPLALRVPENDLDESLKTQALRALWPRTFSTRELFENLVDPRHRFELGGYATFLTEHVLTHLQSGDLPVALSWCARQGGHHDNAWALSKLMDSIVRRAWKRLDDPGVLAGMGDFVASRVANHDDLLRDHDPPLQENREARRRLVITAIGKVADFENHGIAFRYRPQLLDQEDFSWLIEQFERESDPSLIPRWLYLVDKLYRIDVPHHLEAVLSAAPRSKALADRFRWLLTPVDLQSVEAEAMREAHRKSVELERQIKAIPQAPLVSPPPRERLEILLQQSEAGRPRAWIQLTREMTLDERSTHYGDVFEPDLTVSPGWRNADQNTQSRLIGAAACFVAEHECKLGTNILHHAYEGYKALLLLLKVSPDTFAALSRSVWEKWAPVVIAYPVSVGETEEDKPHRQLIRNAYSVAPTECLSTLMSLMLKEDAENHLPRTIHKFEECWDVALCEALVGKLKEATYSGSYSAALLESAMRHGCQNAVRYAASLIRLPLPQDEAERTRVRGAMMALLSFATADLWSELWDLLKTEISFCRELFLAYADDWRASGRLPNALREDQLGDFYYWLSCQFPHSEDPDRHGSNARSRLIGFREQVLSHLMGRGTPQACAAIEELVEKLPNVEWMKWTLVEARRRWRQRAWIPLNPADILKLTAHSDSRLVRSAKELADVVMESLQKLDAILQGETAAAPDLWDANRPKDEGHLSDWVKRHLDRELKSRAIVALREVEIRRGERTDIHVTGIVDGASPNSFDSVRVIIEVKGCWHEDLKDAARTQLAERYLKEHCEQGIYLVGWFRCPAWDKRDTRFKKTPKWTLEKARAYFAEQCCAGAFGSVEVRALVLNAARR